MLSNKTICLDEVEASMCLIALDHIAKVSTHALTEERYRKLAKRIRGSMRK